MRTTDERLRDSLALQRFHLLLIGTFAVLAMILAAIGIYGVMSYLVTRRTREIGIRLALGVHPRHLLVLVLGETFVLTLVASAIGMIAAAGVTRYLQSMLYGITPLDTSSFVIMPVVLALIALAASFGPAQKGLRYGSDARLARGMIGWHFSRAL